MFIQHLEPLSYIQILLPLVLLRFWCLLQSHTTIYTIIIILKQVVRGISAIEGTTNNEIVIKISPKPLLSLTWNTEVRIQPICYSNLLGISSTARVPFLRQRCKTKWFVDNCTVLLQTRNSTRREAGDEWRSIHRFVCFLEFEYVIVTFAQSK